MKLFGYSGPEVRKFITAAVGAAVSVATQVLAMGDVVPPEVANWATVIVSIGTALSVFGVPNEKTEKVTPIPTKGRPGESPTVPLERKRRPVI